MFAATITHISGVGDLAIQLEPDLGVPFLYFKKGNLAFETSMQDSASGYSIQQQDAINQQLAMDALARIP